MTSAVNRTGHLSPTSALNYNRVTATGSTTSRTLRDRFSDVVNVKDFGAVGDGVTDDTGAIQAAIDAAVHVSPVGGYVYLPPGLYKTTSVLTLKNGVSIVGPGRLAATITNSASDVFTWTGTISGVTLQGFRVLAEGGHVVNQGTANIERSVIRDVTWDVQATGKSVWHNDAGGVEGSGIYIDVLVEHSDFSIASAATVAGWRLMGQAGSSNSNTWRRIRVTGNGADVPFFEIENSVAAVYTYDLTFADITGEVCEGGLIDARSVQGLRISNVYDYDSTTYSRSLFKIGKSTLGPNSRNVKISNSGRRGGTLGAGAYDAEAASGTTLIRLESVGPGSAAPSYSLSGAYAEIVGGVGTGLTTYSDVPDGASAVAFNHDTINALTTSGAKAASWKIAGVEAFAIGKDSDLQMPGFLEGTEIADPAAPAANKGRLYVRDNGAGKTQLVVRFPTGAVQVLATEP